MDTIVFDSTKKYGKFKILNATNGGPWHKRHADDQYRTNFEDYKAVDFHYARNHDSAVCGIYGGPYSHDISCIFPDFRADENDPASYDFTCTDEAILVCLEAGVKTFFRLGQTIEHQIRKHGTLPPKDFKKWAVICEHIIRHYTEGWADSFFHDMPYWEIWNEPDLDGDNSPNKRTWGGTKAQFFELYAITASHLKKCFPHLKIGGPALAGREDWAEEFLIYMSERKIPIDFFSWHIYSVHPESITKRAERMKNLLIKYGYGDAESILNEWNYVGDWGKNYVQSLKAIHGIKGASFTAAVICSAHQSSIDMLMYYDTRPSVFCGLFDFYTYEKLKGYYPFRWYADFYALENEIRTDSLPQNVYCICGEDKNGKRTCMLAYYDNESIGDAEIRIDFPGGGPCDVYLLDDVHDGDLIVENGTPVFKLKNYSVVLIKEN